MTVSAIKLLSVVALPLLAGLALLSLAPRSFTQTTVGTGSIVGTVSDPSGAVIARAQIAITNMATGQVIKLTTNSSGSFHSGALIPANYKVNVLATGFRSVEAGVTVLVATPPH